MEPIGRFRLSGIDINGVGVFRNLKLRFKEQRKDGKAEIHLFTGYNGTGKTTLLQALTYFDTAYKMYRSGKNVYRVNEKSVDSLMSKFDFKITDYQNLIDIEWAKDVISIGKTSFTGRGILTATIDLLNRYYTDIGSEFYDIDFFLFAYSGNRELHSGDIEVFKDVNYNPLVDALDFNKTSLNTNLFQWIANVKTRAALAFQKGNKDTSENYLENLNLVEQALSKITGRELEFIIDEKSLKVKIKINKVEISFNDLADGYKSVITWLVDLIFRLDMVGFVLGKKDYQKTFILFLDEIEVHLHPAAQRRILPVIQDLFPTAQIFITTHSPFIIGSVDGAWVYKFKLDENGYSVLDGEPFLSEDGQSYRYIMEEVLGVKEEFGIGAEEQLKEFYKIRDEILKDPNNGHQKEFLQLAKELAVQGEELKSIVGSELRQLSRVTKKEFSI